MPQILFQAHEPKGPRLAHRLHTRVHQHVHVRTPKIEPREFDLPNCTPFKLLSHKVNTVSDMYRIIDTFITCLLCALIVIT